MAQGNVQSICCIPDRGLAPIWAAHKDARPALKHPNKRRKLKLFKALFFVYGVFSFFLISEDACDFARMHVFFPANPGGGIARAARADGGFNRPGDKYMEHRQDNCRHISVWGQISSMLATWLQAFEFAL